MLFDLLWSAGVEFLSLNCRNSSNKTLIVRHPDLLEWMVIITKPDAVKAWQHKGERS
jgi:hypothetical protein